MQVQKANVLLFSIECVHCMTIVKTNTNRKTNKRHSMSGFKTSLYDFELLGKQGILINYPNVMQLLTQRLYSDQDAGTI